VTDVFTAPDDGGDLKSSDFSTSMVDRLGAQWADTLDPKDSLSGMWLARQARQSNAASIDQAVGAGGDIDVFSGQSLEDRQAAIDARVNAIPDISQGDAKDLLKQEGLTEQDVHLGDAPTHKLPVLKMQIAEAHTRRDRQAAIERGPQGFFPDALGAVTSIGVGMIDPVNAAAFSIPVIGEARMGKIIASAGDSILARGAARFGQGAAQGAVGTAVLQPADWWLHTRDGQDYTMAQAMESIIMGAGMGGAFHAGFGAFGDYSRRRQGLPLEGSPADQVLKALVRRGEAPPDVPLEPMPTVAAVEEVPGITPEPTAPAPIFHPADVIADLPPSARQDAVHAAMADIISDRPVRSAEMLNIAADHDPRIAESMDAWHRAGEVVNLIDDADVATLSPAAAREAVFDDIHQKLISAGMDEDEAGYNAALVASRYATRAERLGDAGNAFDLYRSEGLELRSGEFNEAQGRAFQQRRGQGPDLFAEREAEGQTSLPGTERISQGELAQRKADEALKPKVAQKPMDEGLFGDSAAQKSFFQSQPTAPAFYSALGRAVDLTKQEKASPEQWLGMLKNAASVKPEEMKWLGLEDWLREQKGSVTKQQLQDFIRANQIEVKEVKKGEPQHRGGNFVEPTKYQGYKLLGGENYRELLLTLPEKNAFDPSKVRIERVPLSTTQGNVRLFYGDQRIGSSEDNPRLDPATGRYETKPDEYWIDLMCRRAGGDRSVGIGPLDQGANFRSSHWEEPNILAHIRFDDRVSDGKKTLHVAEVQSDWHQAGKRKGYALPAPGEADIDLKFIPPRVPEGHNPDVYPGYWESFDKRTGEMIGRHPGRADRATAMQEAIDGGANIQRRKIPDAPFKTTWPELAMKRMIRYAAEHGYDRISWDTGATNADRYSLAKQIKSLRWNETTGDLQAKDHSGEVVMRRTASADELPDIIGKEAALKLIDQKPVEINLLPPVHKEYLTVEQTEHQYIVTNVDGRKVDIGKGTAGSEAEAKEYCRALPQQQRQGNQPAARTGWQARRAASHA
jgi:hypothetical protein